MKVELADGSIDVVDDPATAASGFWAKFGLGRWKPNTLAAIDENLTPGQTFLDVGAWVGPTALWAARRGAHVRALEPDPAALAVLQGNVAANCDNVSIWPQALWLEEGRRRLWSEHNWGDAQSSLVPRPGGTYVEVDTVTIHQALDELSDVGLVKIDIQGAEAHVIPAIAPVLAALGCPIILTVYWAWIVDPWPLGQALSRCHVTHLDPEAEFPTLLMRP